MVGHSFPVSETLPYVLFMENYAPPEDFWFSSPVFKRRERNSSFVILSPLAQIACQVRSRVSHNSSVTRIARSLLRGSPDLGLAIRALLSGCSVLHPIIKYIKILIQNHHMSSVIPRLSNCGRCDFRSYPKNNKSDNRLKFRHLHLNPVLKSRAANGNRKKRFKKYFFLPKRRPGTSSAAAAQEPAHAASPESRLKGTLKKLFISLSLKIKQSLIGSTPRAWSLYGCIL